MSHDETLTPRFDECVEDRQREVFVIGFRHLVEFGGKADVFRQRAMPLAVVINQATKLPLRQFQLEQCKRRVGERAG